MAGLIAEIQADALSSLVPIDALLRRVKLAAAKLQLEALETWVEQELNGYECEPPDYRIVFGQPAGWHPNHGWIPIYLDDPAFMELISRARIAQAVASLRDILESHSEGHLHFPMLPAQVATLNSILNYQTARIVIQLGRGSIVTILDKVRNMVLDWAIAMEKKGVLGQGMSFDIQEKKQAQAAMSTFNIGNIGNFVGNLGLGNTSGDVVVTQHAADQIAQIAAKIMEALPALVDEGADRGALSASVSALKREASAKAPSATKLKGLLCDVRASLAGAVGNLTSEGALALISLGLKTLS